MFLYNRFVRCFFGVMGVRFLDRLFGFFLVDLCWVVGCFFLGVVGFGRLLCVNVYNYR